MSMNRASLDKQPSEVAAMFDTVASRYDITNDIMSLGQDRRWRRAVVAATGVGTGDLVLDLAAGTGTSTAPFADRGAWAVACDFSIGMLAAGRRARPQVPFVGGDATSLPFPDETFDAVTISFGLRNLVDASLGLREMRRVTKGSGTLVVCEFSSPTFGPFRSIYHEYLMQALPFLARKVSSSPDSYAYLAESIRAWPDQPALATVIADAGWRKVEYRNLSGGIVALHRALR